VKNVVISNIKDGKVDMYVEELNRYYFFLVEVFSYLKKNQNVKGC
jgi:hypothetical protein